MKIAVYSGSFDPLHIGHQAIMEYLTGQAEFDWVYLIVTPQSPFKEAERVLSARRRYEAAIDAVKRHPELRVWVDDIELEMDPPHYTIRTLDALKEREPENEFTLVIGADNLGSFTKWRDPQRILTEYGVVVYPREGFDIKAISEDLTASMGEGCRIQIIDAPQVNMSSSWIRQAIKEGKDVSEYLM